MNETDTLFAYLGGYIWEKWRLQKHPFTKYRAQSKRSRFSMSMAIKYVGLDVSKSKIAVAFADEGRGEARYFGVIEHSKEAVLKLLQRLRRPGEKEEVTLRVCYEAGPTGYVLYRWLLTAGIACSVVAPSLIPKRAGDRVKTDKRDAIRLAQLYRAGELTPVYVPTPADESLRDLVRAREDAVEDLNRFKQRLGKFLLRHQLQDAKGAKPGTFAYEEWLDTLRFPEDSCKQMTFQEYRQSIWETKERIKRYEKQIEEQAALSEQAPVVQALQALRGVAAVTAVTLSSEMMSSDRFHSASSFMSYCGLVSSEYSSGGSRWQGRITKAGNAHLRRVLVEAAKSYRHAPAIRRRMRDRIEGLPPEVQSIAWSAQHRLHKKYWSLARRGKHKGCIAVAIARELAGFVWAIAKEIEKLRLQAAV
ncbi:IS110 family RNA-guided transposase [Cohnella rhizosphaerae]|uniref:IS110 family transposase n=1 Tax=Cohnella rhizosphaerae TaxID=1457232 RepID=A0A9X4L0A5_9BACL|nr:IS110 family transposase [Cohnella rhizosphaerae]MDG0814579.1 IS110 family transposase [Cohnella rhizosphaerae]